MGDWALSVWNPKDRSLILAKDPIGTRYLYYSLDKDQVSWSTILDPLVLLAEKTFALEEEYIAGWLSFFPATHLTPYVGIHSVPPASSALLRAGKHMLASIGISIRPGESVTARAANTKSTSAPSSRNPCGDGYVRTAPSSPNSAVEWIPPLSCAWRTHLSREDWPRPAARYGFLLR